MPESDSFLDVQVSKRSHPALALMLFGVAVAVSPAVADLTAAITADTWVAAHTPTFNFNGGIQGGAEIDGNDPGGWLRYVIEGSDFFARAAILEFELPVLPAGEVVTGVRLVLWDGERNEDPNASAQVGWLTGDVPLMRKITYMDLAPPGFGGGEDNFDAIDQARQALNFDPVKVQFAVNANSAEDLMAMNLLTSGTRKKPDPYVPYEDLTVADGLAQYVAARMGPGTTQTVRLILSPIGSSDVNAMIHGIDASTPTSDIRLDLAGTPSNPAFHPRLEILTTTAQAPQVPEPASAALVCVSASLALRADRRSASFERRGPASRFSLLGPFGFCGQHPRGSDFS